jgi:hypothetical protein
MLRNNNDKTPHELWKGSADNNLYIKTKICKGYEEII